MLMAPFVRVECCHYCGNRDLRLVIDLGNQPLANSLQASPRRSGTRHQLRVVRCAECSLLQLDVNIDPEILFSHYVWTTGTSPSTMRYCRSLAERIFALVDKPQPYVLEMASNDGTLLQEFQQLGASVLGVDPAANIAAAANVAGVPTLPSFFSLATAVQLVTDFGMFDVAIARNVMSHVVNLRDSAKALAQVLVPGGYAFIEFHSASTILTELHYDSIYHEHTFYHSVHSMSALLRSVGLQPVDLWSSPVSGGSWTLVARKAFDAQDVSAVLDQELNREIELGILDQSRWEQFAEEVFQHRKSVLTTLDRYTGASVVGYGASARSSTVINFWGLGPDVISHIADSNPLKQGLHSPGSGIPIVAPVEALETNPDCVLIFAFNFVDEIRDQLSSHGWRGDLLIPFPRNVRVESI